MAERVTAVLNRSKTALSRLGTLAAWMAIFLYKAGDKVSGAKAYFDAATAPSSSRWGAFTSLLALSALFVALGGWVGMNAMVWTGIGMGVAALILAVYWLVTGPRQPPVTVGDVKSLGKELGDKIDGLDRKTETAINNLAGEIGLERQSRKGRRKSDGGDKVAGS